MKQILFALFLSILLERTAAQGCSDAGFCSLSVLKNQQNSNTFKNSFTIGLNYGSGEQSTSSINPYLEYARMLNSRFSMQVKITATYATGFLGNSFNLGDAFGFVTYRASPSNNKNSFVLLGGIKIPFTVSNDKNSNGKPLPLDYQSSLGTFDAIAGFNFIANNKWEINAGIQQPIVNRNKNTFFPEEYSDARASKFAPTNNFERKTDLLIRFGNYIKLPKSFTIKPNLLLIYHTANDTYEDRFGKRQTISHSRGITLNGGIVATKSFNQKKELELVLATPFIYRDTRPDGLTRSAVINLQYKLHF
jgi:hypothetical protein